jgi:sec-independent protein translocase protein TatA
MPFNLGFGELMVVLVIVLVLFGAKRIPEISASFGKGIREFKKNVNEVERSVTEPAPRSEPRLPAGDPVATRREAADEVVRPEPKRLL